MAKRSPRPTLKAAVEAQAGACRALAAALANDANSRAAGDSRNRRLIEGWAAILVDIADALTVASADQRNVGRWSKIARYLAVPLAAGSAGWISGTAQGAGQEWYLDLFGDNATIMDRANDVLAHDEQITAVLIAATPRPPTFPEKTPPPPKSRRHGIRVHELAKELGMTNAEMMNLCNVMGVGVKSHSSTLIEQQADRLRRRAAREGLVRVLAESLEDG